MKTKKISVIGLGYIGLPTAALLACNGYHVVGMDLNEDVVEAINQGRNHFIEPDLDAFVRSAVTSGCLEAYTELQAGDVYIICVPTPLREDEEIPHPNIDHVLAATLNIAPQVKPGDLVILESTSPVGTTDKIQAVLRDLGVNVDGIHIAYCPERVLPGKIMNELVENDRIIGGITPAATKAVADFYKGFVRGDVLETDARTAELCKLTENSFRDVNIAFANEISLICDKEGINVWDLIQLANHHPRVNILQPGVGVGGHCIAVDPWFIITRDESNSRLMRASREVNKNKTKWVIEKIKLAAADFNARTGKKPKITCLCLAFKPDVDDLRESSAIEVARALMEQGYDVVAVEPNIEAHAFFSIVPLVSAFDEIDVIAVLVKHREFSLPEVRMRLIDLGALDFCGALV